MTDKTSSAKRNTTDRLAKEIGKRISDARNGLGWSQSVLHVQTKMADSERVGISRAVLSLYETGTNKPGAREVRILCEALKVSPNWLFYGSESNALATEPSSNFLRGSDVDISARLAFAMLALDPTDRDALSQLVFSILTKKLGDDGLASLMAIAKALAPELLKVIIETVGQDNKNMPILEMLALFTREMSESIYTNVGTLRPAIPEEELDSFDPEYPPPPRVLK